MANKFTQVYTISVAGQESTIPPGSGFGIQIPGFFGGLNSKFGFNSSPHTFDLDIVPDDFGGSLDDLPAIGDLARFYIGPDFFNVTGRITHLEYSDSMSGTTMSVGIQDRRLDLANIGVYSEDIGDFESLDDRGLLTIGGFLREHVPNSVTDYDEKYTKNNEVGSTYRDIKSAVEKSAFLTKMGIDSSVLMPEPTILESNIPLLSTGLNISLDSYRWSFDGATLLDVFTEIFNDLGFDWYWLLGGERVALINRGINFQIDKDSFPIVGTSGHVISQRWGVDFTDAEDFVGIFGARQEGFIDSNLLSPIDGLATPSGIRFTKAWDKLTVGFYDACGFYTIYTPPEKELQLALYDKEFWSSFKKHQTALGFGTDAGVSAANDPNFQSRIDDSFVDTAIVDLIIQGGTLQQGFPPLTGEQTDLTKLRNSQREEVLKELEQSNYYSGYKFIKSTKDQNQNWINEWYEKVRNLSETYYGRAYVAEGILIDSDHGMFTSIDSAWCNLENQIPSGVSFGPDYQLRDQFQPLTPFISKDFRVGAHITLPGTTVYGKDGSEPPSNFDNWNIDPLTGFHYVPIKILQVDNFTKDPRTADSPFLSYPPGTVIAHLDRIAGEALFRDEMLADNTFMQDIITNNTLSQVDFLDPTYLIKPYDYFDGNIDFPDVQASGLVNTSANAVCFEEVGSLHTSVAPLSSGVFVLAYETRKEELLSSKTIITTNIVPEPTEAEEAALPAIYADPFGEPSRATEGAPTVTVFDNSGFKSNTKYTASCYVKQSSAANTSAGMKITLENISATQTVIILSYNFTTNKPELSVTPSSFTDLQLHPAESIGNGWHRIAVTFKNAANISLDLAPSDANTPKPYFFGAQVEETHAAPYAGPTPYADPKISSNQVNQLQEAHGWDVAVTATSGVMVASAPLASPSGTPEAGIISIYHKKIQNISRTARSWQQHAQILPPSYFNSLHDLENENNVGCRFGHSVDISASGASLIATAPFRDPHRSTDIDFIAAPSGTFNTSFYAYGCYELLTDFTSGRNDNNRLIDVDRTVYPRWQLDAAPVGITTGDTRVIASHPDWFDSLPDARWIAPTDSEDGYSLGVAGNYTYEYTFTLDKSKNFDFLLEGWIGGASKNPGKVRLNNSTFFDFLGSTYTGIPWESYFRLDDQSRFNDGLNTLQVFLLGHTPSLSLGAPAITIKGQVTGQPVDHPITGASRIRTTWTPQRVNTDIEVMYQPEIYYKFSDRDELLTDPNDPDWLSRYGAIRLNNLTHHSNYTPGEVVTGAGSGAKARVLEILNGLFVELKYIKVLFVSGTFIPGEDLDSATFSSSIDEVSHSNALSLYTTHYVGNAMHATSGHASMPDHYASGVLTYGQVDSAHPNFTYSPFDAGVTSAHDDHSVKFIPTRVPSIFTPWPTGTDEFIEAHLPNTTIRGAVHDIVTPPCTISCWVNREEPDGSLGSHADAAGWLVHVGNKFNGFGFGVGSLGLDDRVDPGDNLLVHYGYEEIEPISFPNGDFQRFDTGIPLDMGWSHVVCVIPSGGTYLGHHTPLGTGPMFFIDGVFAGSGTMSASPKIPSVDTSPVSNPYPSGFTTVGCMLDRIEPDFTALPGSVSVFDNPQFVFAEGNYYSSGNIDRVALYDRALTPYEVADIYASTAHPKWSLGYSAAISDDGNLAIAGMPFFSLNHDAVTPSGFEAGFIKIAKRFGDSWTITDSYGMDKTIMLHSDPDLQPLKSMLKHTNLKQGHSVTMSPNGDWCAFGLGNDPTTDLENVFSSAELYAFDAFAAQESAPFLETPSLKRNRPASWPYWQPKYPSIRPVEWYSDSIEILNITPSGTIVGVQNIAAPSGQRVHYDDSPIGFGHGLDIKDDLFAVSAPFESILEPGDTRGAIYIYERNGLEWEQTDKIEQFDSIYGACLGKTLTISHDGNMIFAGAATETNIDEENMVGSVYVYRRAGLGQKKWVLDRKILSELRTTACVMGTSISINKDASTIAMGAPQASSPGASGFITYVQNRGEAEDRSGKVIVNEYKGKILNFALKQDNFVKSVESWGSERVFHYGPINCVDVAQYDDSKFVVSYSTPQSGVCVLIGETDFTTLDTSVLAMGRPPLKSEVSSAQTISVARFAPEGVASGNFVTAFSTPNSEIVSVVGSGVGAPISSISWATSGCISEANVKNVNVETFSNDTFAVGYTGDESAKTFPIPSGISENSLFGYSVSISDGGNYAVVGAPFAKSADPLMNGSGIGRAFVYERRDDTWIFDEELFCPEFSPNNSLHPTTDSEEFGRSVVVDSLGLNIFVGHPNYQENSSGTPIPGAGKIHWFVRTATTWEENIDNTFFALDYSSVSSIMTDTHMGVALALSGNDKKLIVGASGLCGGRGGFYYYAQTIGPSLASLPKYEFRQVEIVGTDAGCLVGEAIAVDYDGSFVAVGDPRPGNESATNTVVSDPKDWAPSGIFKDESPPLPGFARSVQDMGLEAKIDKSLSYGGKPPGANDEFFKDPFGGYDAIYVKPKRTRNDNEPGKGDLPHNHYTKNSTTIFGAGPTVPPSPELGRAAGQIWYEADPFKTNSIFVNNTATGGNPWSEGGSMYNFSIFVKKVTAGCVRLFTWPRRQSKTAKHIGEDCFSGIEFNLNTCEIQYTDVWWSTSNPKSPHGLTFFGYNIWSSMAVGFAGGALIGGIIVSAALIGAAGTLITAAALSMALAYAVPGAGLVLVLLIVIIAVVAKALEKDERFHPSLYWLANSCSPTAHAEYWGDGWWRLSMTGLNTERRWYAGVWIGPYTGNDTNTLGRRGSVLTYGASFQPHNADNGTFGRKTKSGGIAPPGTPSFLGPTRNIAPPKFVENPNLPSVSHDYVRETGVDHRGTVHIYTHMGRRPQRGIGIDNLGDARSGQRNKNAWNTFSNGIAVKDEGGFADQYWCLFNKPHPMIQGTGGANFGCKVALAHAAPSAGGCGPFERYRPSFNRRLLVLEASGVNKQTADVHVYDFGFNFVRTAGNPPYGPIAANWKDLTYSQAVKKMITTGDEDGSCLDLKEFAKYPSLGKHWEYFDKNLPPSYYFSYSTALPTQTIETSIPAFDPFINPLFVPPTVDQIVGGSTLRVGGGLVDGAPRNYVALGMKKDGTEFVAGSGTLDLYKVSTTSQLTSYDDTTWVAPFKKERTIGGYREGEEGFGYSVDINAAGSKIIGSPFKKNTSVLSGPGIHPGSGLDSAGEISIVDANSCAGIIVASGVDPIAASGNIYVNGYINYDTQGSVMSLGIFDDNYMILAYDKFGDEGSDNSMVSLVEKSHLPSGFVSISNLDTQLISPMNPLAMSITTLSDDAAEIAYINGVFRKLFISPVRKIGDEILTTQDNLIGRSMSPFIDDYTQTIDMASQGSFDILHPEEITHTIVFNDAENSEHIHPASILLGGINFITAGRHIFLIDPKSDQIDVPECIINYNELSKQYELAAIKIRDDDPSRWTGKISIPVQAVKRYGETFPEKWVSAVPYKNLLLHSNNFLGASWESDSGSTPTISKNEEDPFGVANNAWALDDTNTPTIQSQSIFQAVALPNLNTPYTFSVHAKKGTSSIEHSVIDFTLTDLKGNIKAQTDILLDWRIRPPAVTYRGSNITFGIEPEEIYTVDALADDWYRISFTVKGVSPDSAVTNLPSGVVRILPAQQVAGGHDPTGATIFYGAQLVEGTKVIKTDVSPGYIGHTEGSPKIGYSSSVIGDDTLKFEIKRKNVSIDEKFGPWNYPPRSNILSDFYQGPGTSVEIMNHFAKNLIATRANRFGENIFADVSKTGFPEVSFDNFALQEFSGSGVSPVRTNLLLQSNTFTSSPWTVAAGITLVKDQDAFNFNPNEATSWSGTSIAESIDQSIVLPLQNHPYTFSWFAKNIDSATGGVRLIFTGGTLPFTDEGIIDWTGAIPDWTPAATQLVQHPIEDWGLGWYRFGVTVPASSVSDNTDVEVNFFGNSSTPLGSVIVHGFSFEQSED